MQIQVIDHPLIQHKLTIMRQKETSSGDFRKLLKEITLLMGYELTRDLPMEDIEIETPLEVMRGKRVAGKKVVIVPILRDMMKEKGVKNIKFMCLVAAPEGVQIVNDAHPDVPIYTAALDRRLNEKKYILPGLGDAGDRIFGTK